MIRTSVTIPDDLLRKSKELSSNFSAVVVEALKLYLREVKIKKAIQSFGSWEDRGKDSIEIVKELRDDGDRKYSDGVN